MLNRVKKILYFALFFSLTTIFLTEEPRKVYAADDDVPFFVGLKGLPNVMFIIDNSDSMQDAPYPRLNENGENVPVRPDWKWRQGIKVDENGFVVAKDHNKIDLDESKYLTTDAAVELPGKIPPPVPGIDSLNGEVTSIRERNSDNRIYDDRVDWIDAMFTWNNFQKNYLNYRVKVEDENGTLQFTNIISYDADQKCWIVSPEIEYNPNLTYVYTILTGVPDAVTRQANEGKKLYDCHVDWETAHEKASFYRNKIIKITEGPKDLDGVSSTIRGVSKDGYWVLSPGFSKALPVGARYRIVGSEDDDRYAKGGNHPDSKLYQAKKALKTFLESDKIKICENRDLAGVCKEERYLVNFGFGTYMSARVPAVKAKYFRRKQQPASSIPAQHSALFKKQVSREYRFIDLNSDSQFVTSDWKTRAVGAAVWTEDQLHENVYVGYRLERLVNAGACGQQIVIYTVYDIAPAPTDSSSKRHIFKLRSRVGQEGGEPFYSRRRYTVASCEDLPKKDEDWELVSPDDNCFSMQKCSFHPPESKLGASFYETRYVTTWGDYDVSDPDTAGFIDVNNGITGLPEVWVTPCPGYDGDSTGRCISNPNPELGDFTLVAETIYDVPIDANQTLGNINPNIFDVSTFRYPADGTRDRPHGWSYQKTEDKFLYRRYKNYPTTWEENIQPDSYFPASVEHEQSNHKGDDQILFINLPAYKDGSKDPFHGDDVWGQNVSKLLNYVSLARVESPDNSSDYEARYDYTMMPYTNSLPVNSEEEISGAGTPLAASLRNVRKYYESYIQQDDFSQGGCRKNYVILLTDGLETCDGDPEAEAAALYNSEINGLTAEIKTYVIGFGMDEKSRAALDAIAKAGGTNQAYLAHNVEELVDILAENIVEDIFSNSYSRSSPVLSRRINPEDNLKIFNSYFDYPIWRGHLEGRYVMRNGDIGDPLEGWTSDCTGEAGADGDAGCEMAVFGRGRTLTNVNGNMANFRTTNASTFKDLINPNDLDIDGDGRGGSTADAATIIEYVLDADFEDGRYKGTRDRNWPLGDIYNSSAVWVGAPQTKVLYRPGYNEFAKKNAYRREMLFVGGNDGMLHAFNENNGREAWAFIPRSVIHVLNEFRQGHRFTVDLKIKAADVLTTQGWKTILASGLREGGRHYYALDITDTVNPEFLWEITDGNMGKTYSIPVFGQISISGVNVGVLFVGGGYSSRTDKGNRVYIIRAEDGEILSEIIVGDSDNNVPSELLAVRFSENENTAPYAFHSQAPVIFDWRGNVEFCYFGDTAGTLWKLGNLNSGPGEPWTPTLEPLYVPDNPMPITHRPAVHDEKDICHRRFISFGTGDEMNPTNIDQHYFYEIEDIEWEDYQAAHPGQLWTGTDIAEGKFRKKWRYDFSYGEQLLTDPATYYNLVYFITYKPSGGCAAGTSYIYSFTTSRCSFGAGSGRPDRGEWEQEEGYESHEGEGGENYHGPKYEPEGTGGGVFFGFPEPFDADGKEKDASADDGGDSGGNSSWEAVRPVEIQGITSSLVIAPPKAYFNPGDPLPVPTDPAILLYWRESQ